jgi:hypothetical protein
MSWVYHFYDEKVAFMRIMELFQMPWTLKNDVSN